MKKFLALSPSALYLIAANTIPLIGVWLWGWDTASILILYWLETVIIGLLNVPKLIFAAGGPTNSGRPAGIGAKIFLVCFFLVHFGMFNYGHGVFIADMFKAKSQFAELKTGGPLLLTGFVFFVSHFMSMMINFFGKGEYKDRDPSVQMFLPYGRVVVMHLVIIMGGGVAVMLGQPILALVLLVLIKTVMDLAVHNLEHGPSSLLGGPQI